MSSNCSDSIKSVFSKIFPVFPKTIASLFKKRNHLLLLYHFIEFDLPQTFKLYNLFRSH